MSQTNVSTFTNKRTDKWIRQASGMQKASASSLLMYLEDLRTSGGRRAAAGWEGNPAIRKDIFLVPITWVELVGKWDSQALDFLLGQQFCCLCNMGAIQ